MGALEDLEKALGESDDPSTVKTFVDSGYAPLNYALSQRWDGGFPVGRIVELFGPSSAGKTALATKAMISAQRQKGVSLFMDHERSFQHPLAEKLGLNTKQAFLFKKPRTFEESMDLVTQTASRIRKGGLIPDDAPIAAVFDSLASMVPKSKLFDPKTGKDRDIADFNMHDKLALASATSTAFPAFNQLCEELGVCAIFLNQTRTKPGVMYGDPTTTPGGDSPKFYASIRIQLGATRIMEGKGPDAVMLGQEVKARCIKNKVTRPFLTAKWRFMFQPDGTGKLHVAYSLIDFLLEQDVLKKDGNYIVWEGKKRYPKELAAILDSDEGVKELMALMPKLYAPAEEVAVEADEGAASDLTEAA